MKTKRRELVTALVHTTGMLSRAMHGGIQAEREIADLARRGEEDLESLRHERDKALAGVERAHAELAATETSYQNACDTIQRQSDELQAYRANDASGRERLLTAARERAQKAEGERNDLQAEIDGVRTAASRERKERDEARQAVSTMAQLRGGDQATIERLRSEKCTILIERDGLREERDNLAARNADLEEQVRRISGLCRAGESPRRDATAAWKETCADLRGKLEKALAERDDAQKAHGSALAAEQRALAEGEGHKAAAHRSAERMAAAAEELQKVRPALRPGPGPIPEGVDRALDILTGDYLPPMKEEPLIEATRRAASRPVSEEERRYYAGTASQRNEQRMRELQGLDTFPKVVVGGEEV